MDYSTLPTVSALSDCVSIAQLDQIKVIRVDHPHASAAISLFGGHVLSYTPQAGQDLIWMSEQAKFDGQTAIRGGIPICWPWFGRIHAPAHGFARNSDWELIEHRENEHGVMIELALFASEATHDIWPHLFDARLLIEVGKQLTVTFKVMNIDDTPWRFSGALHSYLNIGDIHQAQTQGLGNQYIDSLADNQVCSSDGTLKLIGSVDRVYTQPEAVIKIEDPELKRTVCVDNQGHNSAVVWNPWSEGAQAMADMQDNGFETMLCVESTVHANSLDAGAELKPGESHTLVTRLSV